METSLDTLESSLPSTKGTSPLASFDGSKVRKNLVLIDRYYTALRMGDVEAAVACVTEDVNWTVVPSALKVKGREEFRRQLQGRWAAAPDRREKVLNVMANEEHVSVELLSEGTLTGAYEFKEVLIPASGRAYSLQSSAVFHFRDGLIDHVHEYFEPQALQVLLGPVVPRAPQEASELYPMGRMDRVEPLPFTTLLQGVHLQRLALLGEMSAGIAHELKNPLATATLAAECLVRKAPDEEIRRRAQVICDQLALARRIFGGVLDRARAGSPEAVEMDMVKVVRETIEFVKASRSEPIEIVESYPDSVARVFGDPIQVGQVITNLLVNAYDAIGEKPGKICVSVVVGSGDVTTDVVDDGPGVPLHLMPNLFEPFFTTKARGKGTGLGLGISRGIVEGLGGSLTLEPSPGTGACFRVRLPERKSSPQTAALVGA